MAAKVKFQGARVREARKRSTKGTEKQRAARHKNAKAGSLGTVSNAPIPY